MSSTRSTLFSKPYRAAAAAGIQAARIETGRGVGLFAATRFDPQRYQAATTTGNSPANDANYVLAWVRDTLKCGALDRQRGDRDRVQATTQVLLRYFHQEQATLQATRAAAQAGHVLDRDRHTIQPRMHPLTLAPLPADQGKNLQLDMAEMLTHIAQTTRQGLWQPESAAELDLLQAIVDYFLAWDYSLQSDPPGDFGIWEEGQGGTTGQPIPEVHTSTIAAMVTGYLHIQGLTLQARSGAQITLTIPETVIQRGVDLVNHRLQTLGETPERTYDLTHLIILNDHLDLVALGKPGILSEATVERILASLPKLERDRGLVRYASAANPDCLDTYHQSGSPTGRSAEWPLGFGYAALIYAKLGDIDRAQAYVAKLERCFDWETGLGLPEAYFGGTDRPVPVSPLTWANALYLLVAEYLPRDSAGSIAAD